MYCDECDRDDAVKTTWLPSRGMDPMVREYKCKKCGHVFYERTGRRYLLAARRKEEVPSLIPPPSKPKKKKAVKKTPPKPEEKTPVTSNT